mmetsp:Transcript_48552/g.117453  ORF Transcript_48552/g.117453 Transcript_48552/m.117453 type:complete len:217 (+) Transcript_48552:684-1334(+)
MKRMNQDPTSVIVNRSNLQSEPVVMIINVTDGDINLNNNNTKELVTWEERVVNFVYAKCCRNKSVEMIVVVVIVMMIMIVIMIVIMKMMLDKLLVLLLVPRQTKNQDNHRKSLNDSNGGYTDIHKGDIRNQIITIVIITKIVMSIANIQILVTRRLWLSKMRKMTTTTTTMCSLVGLTVQLFVPRVSSVEVEVAIAIPTKAKTKTREIVLRYHQQV